MKNIQEAFQNGVEGYTPATMWFTSGNINKKEMTYQIEGFQKQGIQDYFIHPSDGTQGDYLGKYFFRMIKHAADEAKRLGMHYWIYDEYNWPSGNAAGQVLMEAPWTHGSCLTRIQQKVAAGETVRIVLPEKEKNNTQPLLFTADGQEVEVVLDGDTVIWTNPFDREKTLEVYFTAWTLRKIECLAGSEVVEAEAEGYLDTLDQEAVRFFIQKTHEAYKENIGEGFGDYVKGVFTDEVTTMPQAFGEKRPEYPWSRFFAEKFKERNGYDIRPRVKDLMDSTDPKLSVDYWETVTDLFMSAYMELIYDWCTENGLIYTGHLLIEEGMESTVCRSGDPYEYYKRFTWPGIDTICTYYLIDNYDYNITAKRTSSAAHFLNKERVLSETYTVSGWEIKLRDMKRIFNRLALLGVNFIQFMGSKYDFMPGMDYIAMTNNWQNPLFKHYSGFSRYISGIQWLVANTVYDARTLLFYPMTTARIMAAPIPADKQFCRDLDLTLQGLVNALLNLHVPFEIGFEQVIEEARAEDGKLYIGDAVYDTLILPCTRYLKEKTFRKIQEFACSGGRIIEVNGVPEKVIGGSMFDAPVLENAVSYECYEYEIQGKKRQRAPMGAFTACLKEAMQDAGISIVKIQPCDGLFSAVRKKDGTYYIMLINDNDNVVTAKGEMLAELPFRAINTEDGALHAMKKQGRSFEIQLAAYECVILEASDAVTVSADKGCAGSDMKEEKAVIELNNVTFRINGLNTALPQMWQVRGAAAEEIKKARHIYNPRQVCELADALRPEELAICRGTGNIYVPEHCQADWFGWYPADRKKTEAGETAVCIYDFTLDGMPDTLELVSDPQFNTVWYLNDEQLYQTSTRREWHYANPVFDIRDIAQPGKNRLISICTFPDYELNFPMPCAVLKGDFRVFEETVLTQKSGGNAIDYWNDQGYMCHGGEGIYAAEFTVRENKRAFLELETKDVAEVYVNGTSVGKRLWDPYRLELTEYLKEGTNQLEIVVTSTLSNLLYDGSPSGLKGIRIITDEMDSDVHEVLP